MERSHASLPPLPHHTELLETKLIVRESSQRKENPQKCLAENT